MNNKEIRMELRIPRDELHFVDVPEEYKNFRIVNYGFAGKYLMELDSTGLNHWKTLLPPGYDYEILGFSKDVLIDPVEDALNFVLRIS